MRAGYALACAVSLIGGRAAAATVTIADSQSIAPKDGDPAAGEAQSTVVAPGLKSQCVGGRVLVSDDKMRPWTVESANGLVSGRDLGGEATIRAAFTSLPPNPANYDYVTNDHDLLVLPSGDVLYITGAGSKAAITPKPKWFDYTFRDNFGPGAHSVVLVWRSTDCGETFQFDSEMDPAFGYPGNGTVQGASSKDEFHYYPIWIAPDGAVHYASVTYKDAVSIPPEGVISLKLVAHKARGRLVTGPAPIPLSNYTLSPFELERLEVCYMIVGMLLLPIARQSE